MFEDLTAILLAAGHSTRLWPIEDKLFLSFLGKPLIQYSLDRFKNIGLKNIIVVASPANYENCKKLISINSDINLKLAVQNNKKGMAGALLSAAKILTTERILVVGPSDIVEDFLYQDFVKLQKSDP